MGISGSKLPQNIEDPKTDETASIPSTPILTPKNIRETLKNDALDPRSPSKHIARTPIEVLNAAANKLSGLAIKDSNSDSIAVETPLKRHVILGIDPRSPTLEIQRTPIVVSASPDKKLPCQIKNKNLDRVKSCVISDSPRVVPPKLLNSNSVTPKVNKGDSYKRKSFVLLETNVDYTETDLDAVIKEKYLGRSLQNLSCAGEVSYSEIDDPRSPTIEFFRTPVQVIKSSDPVLSKEQEALIENHVKNKLAGHPNITEECVPVGNCPANVEDIRPNKNEFIAEIKCDNVEDELITLPDAKTPELKEDSMQNKKEDVSIVTPDYEVCNTCVSPINMEEREITSEESVATTPCKTELIDEVVELSPIPKEAPQLTAKSAPVSPPQIVSVTPKKSKSQPVTPPILDLTPNVRELDKKLANLIYEDEDLVVCPRVIKPKEGTRTPLGVRNNNENKKSGQKLKVSDKPRKGEYVVSKIPVFKEKKIKVQCENTPPRGMKVSKPKRSQWDPKDDTLVI